MNNINNIETGFSIEKVRSDFPILNEKINGIPLFYFDNAATTQKPRCVIDKLVKYYNEYNSNVHRSAHTLSTQATKEFENTRDIIREFINAKDSSEIIFTSGATGAINLVAYSFGKAFVKEGDEIVITAMEHHSNLVPWQMLCKDRGAILNIVPVDDNGVLDLNEYANLINEKTKLVAAVHISNMHGVINPIERMIKIAHLKGAPFLLDASQSIQHTFIDVQNLNCDFLAFSGHKIYGPTGVGVLYGKKEYLEIMPPYQCGGEMISNVQFEKTTFNSLPYKFEAGTPNIASVIGLGTAIDYFRFMDMKAVFEYEHQLVHYAEQALSKIEGIRIIAFEEHKGAAISFVSDKLHHSDIATMLDLKGIAIRAGHHCTQPLIERLGLTGTARLSLAFYNTYEEIDYFIDSLKYILNKFGQ